MSRFKCRQKLCLRIREKHCCPYVRSTMITWLEESQTQTNYNEKDRKLFSRVFPETRKRLTIKSKQNEIFLFLKFKYENPWIVASWWKCFSILITIYHLCSNDWQNRRNIEGSLLKRYTRIWHILSHKHFVTLNVYGTKCPMYILFPIEITLSNKGETVILL